jgi:hypothetical protein
MPATPKSTALETSNIRESEMQEFAAELATELADEQLVEAYLDRVHPTWREDVARGEESMARGPGGPDGTFACNLERTLDV